MATLSWILTKENVLNIDICFHVELNPYTSHICFYDSSPLSVPLPSVARRKAAHGSCSPKSTNFVKLLENHGHRACIPAHMTLKCCSVKTTQVPEPGTPAPVASHLEREKEKCLQCRTRTSRWVHCRTHRFFGPRGLAGACFELLLHLSFWMTPRCFSPTWPVVGENREHHGWAL